MKSVRSTGRCDSARAKCWMDWLKPCVQTVLVCACILVVFPAARAEQFSCGSFRVGDQTLGDVNCLIDAINSSNSPAFRTQANTIVLANGDYLLPTRVDEGLQDGFTGLPSITSVLTIRGDGPTSTIISRDTAANTPPFRIFRVADAGSLTLNGVAVGNGRAVSFDPILRPAAGFGGAILVRDAGTLILNDVFIFGNEADNSGGGIFNGTPFFHPVLGILATPGTGVLTITKSAILENRALASGGGITIFNEGPGTITDSLIEGNISGNEGGGIFALTVEIARSTISFNRAVKGGGMDTSGSSIVNSTISSNVVSDVGGGIRGGPVDLVNVTISNNTASGPNGGGGISAGEPIWRIKNSLIVDNVIGGKY